MAFERVGQLTTGYDPDQVDELLARARAAYETSDTLDTLSVQEIRAAAFDLVRNGYNTNQVDAALDRLESAFIQHQRAAQIDATGQDDWMDGVAQRATTLYGRLVRPAGQRFAPPSHGRGYDSAAVDALLDRLVSYFKSGTPLQAQEIRLATFPSARGSRAYGEGAVDSYLDRAVEVLLAVE